jgi:hypothetical protein
MEQEIWKECVESKRRIFKISNYGNLKSISKVDGKEKILKGRINNRGNGYISYNIDNKRYNCHFLVISTFTGQRPDGMLIDHIDRDTYNNHISNLRYVTPKENSRNRHTFRDDIIGDGNERKKKLSAERFICECGSNVRKSQKYEHFKTEKHKKYLNSLL